MDDGHPSVENGGGRYMSVQGMGIDPEADRALMKSLRMKVLEFENERAAYIDTLREVLQPPDEGDGATQEKEEGSGAGQGGIAMFSGRRMSTLRAAREERRASGEEIRVLQQRKADAAVRLQGERLSNLEQGLELGVLRLERLLDRERILELLRLTDPSQPPSQPTTTAARGGWAADGDEEVSLEVIEELEDRVEAAEELVRNEASKLGVAIAGKLGQRSRREEESRHEGRIARDEVLQLQGELKDKEDRLSRTVMDYLELRHVMLRARRISTEARAQAEESRTAQTEEIQQRTADLAEKRRQTQETVERACESLGRELRRQIQLREEEACMLSEQHAETEKLHDERVARLECLLKDWKSKYGALRRRFSLETEGFRRDADEIGRRFERIRAGPPGGRPVISSRSGSSARLAVEHAIYRPDSAGFGAPHPRRFPEAYAGLGPARDA